MSKCALLAAGTAMSAVSLLAATAYPQEPSHPDDSAHATAQRLQTGPTPAEVSQLCRIDIRGDKKDAVDAPAEGGEFRDAASPERRRQDDRLHGHRRHAHRARRRGQADGRASATSPTCARARRTAAHAPSPSPSTADPAPPRYGCTWECSDRDASSSPIPIRRRRRPISWSTTSTDCSTRATW